MADKLYRVRWMSPSLGHSVAYDVPAPSITDAVRVWKEWMGVNHADEWTGEDPHYIALDEERRAVYESIAPAVTRG